MPGLEEEPAGIAVHRGLDERDATQRRGLSFHRIPAPRH